MIRCIPVDGSAPFEVEDDAVVSLQNARRMRGETVIFTEQIKAGELAQGPPNIVLVGDVRARMESWRERAERLEKELEALRHQNALDIMDWRRESEHG
jgi:hypothetical protein